MPGVRSNRSGPVLLRGVVLLSDDFVPVIAADVPENVRQALNKKPGFRVPACYPQPARWRIIAQAGFLTLGAVLLAGVLSGAGGALLFGIGALVGLLIPINGTVETIFWVLLATVGVILMIAAGIGSAVGDDSDWRRLDILRHHGRYFCEQDFDTDELALIKRAQKAADAVTKSKVNGLGLLAEVDNQTVLPARIWEISQVLRVRQNLRGRHQLAALQMRTPELDAVLKPQQEALDRSAAAITRQVETMEEYARLAAQADSAYEAKKLVDANDEYRELLVRSGDTEGFGHLAAEAEQAGIRLDTALAEAVAVGRSLTVG